MVLAHDINEGRRTQDIRIQEGVTFDTMLLSDKTLTGLKKSGFYTPSPIQLHGIPIGKCGFDLLLEAKSGTGKTAVFTIIALEKLDIAKGLQMVILAPTREIAAQICDVIKQIGSQHTDLIVEVVMGGLSVSDDISKFKKKVHIVVGSPGRLRQLVAEKHVDLSAVRLFVLDEADKLMEKSFLPDIDDIFSVLPKQKQVIMSSATYPEICRSYISKYVQNPQHICPDSDSILLGISQQVTIIKHNSNIVRQTQHRFEELLKIIARKQFKQCLIFCNYQARVAELHKLLEREKWPVELLHGQQQQTDRLDALKTLQEYKCRILTSTDLAARGIDASNVDLVINFEPPYDWQTYLHRIGRAGRFGSHGTAISILSEGKEVNKFKETLCTLKESLDLRHLWKGDKFCLDDVENHEPSLKNTRPVLPSAEESITGDKHKDLWNAIITDSVTKIDEIQSFEDLHIESSSDLLCSFQQGGDTTEANDSYRHVKFHKIQIPRRVSYTQTAKKSINKAVKNSSTQECIDMNGKKNGIDNVNKIFNENNFKNIELNNDEKEIVPNSIDTGNRVNNALLEAGLPTSFGKVRNSNTKSKHHTDKFISHHDYRKDNKDLSTSSDYNSINEKSTVSISTKSKRSSRTSANKDDASFCKQQSQQQNKSHWHSSDKQERKYIETHSSKQHNIQHETRNHNYNIWYNQLKTHMKHLEYMVYINEMSKL